MMRQDQNTSLERWLRLMDGWGFDANRSTYEALITKYLEAGRHYHTLRHLDACLKNLDECIDQTDHPRLGRFLELGS